MVCPSASAPGPKHRVLRGGTQAQAPFVVCGSTVVKQVNGAPRRVREYPWGAVDIEAAGASEFTLLRAQLIRTHLLDLVDVTHTVYGPPRPSPPARLPASLPAFA